MTAPTASTSQHESGWPDELATYLGPTCFPATHDHLAATLIQRHAPSHLLWHLASAPRHRQFQSLDELVDQLEQAPNGPQGTFGEPS
jgi:hypothetical protein